MKLRWWHRVSRAWPSLGKLLGSNASTQPAQPRSEDDRADLERRPDYTFVRPEVLRTPPPPPSAAVGSDLPYEPPEFPCHAGRHPPIPEPLVGAAPRTT